MYCKRKIKENEFEGKNQWELSTYFSLYRQDLMDISSFNVLLILNNILPLSVGKTGVKQVKNVYLISLKNRIGSQRMCFKISV